MKQCWNEYNTAGWTSLSISISISLCNGFEIPDYWTKAV